MVDNPGASVYDISGAAGPEQRPAPYDFFCRLPRGYTCAATPLAFSGLVMIWATIRFMDGLPFFFAPRSAKAGR
jgi:hypothetical protein